VGSRDSILIELRERQKIDETRFTWHLFTGELVQVQSAKGLETVHLIISGTRSE
jgi:hypothetical protein